ncbi:MAG: FHA domain-containing protein [Chloroflexi bacterium]|nr:FHA domain-containing protein [Chloroflexota bacterium]
MQKCPTCGHMNRPGVVFCENCGTNLIAGARPQSTKALDSEKQGQIEMSLGRSVFDTGEQGAATFPEGGILRMEIDGSPDPIILRFEHHEMILGRRDPATGALPDVDLTPFAGYRMGVSRRHSLIRLTDKRILEILDLGSANGTNLNGRRLEAHHPQTLHDGDRIKLGEITLLVRFQKSPDEGDTSPVKSTEPIDTNTPAQTALLGITENAERPSSKPPQPPLAGTVTKSPATSEPASPKPTTDAPAPSASQPNPAVNPTVGSTASPKSDVALDTQRVDDKPPSDGSEPPKTPEPPKA